MISDKRKKPVHEDDDNAAAERGKERSTAIDRAREDRRENDNEHRIERGLARERALMSDPDHDQCRKKDDNTAQRDLDKGQVLRLRAQTENWINKIVERIHIRRRFARTTHRARIEM